MGEKYGTICITTVVTPKRKWEASFTILLLSPLITQLWSYVLVGYKQIWSFHNIDGSLPEANYGIRICEKKLGCRGGSFFKNAMKTFLLGLC